MPRGRTYVGSAQAVGIGSRPSAVDLGASGLNLPGCHVMVKKSVRPRRFIRGVPGEQSKQRLQGMKGMLRTRERMSRLPKTCCHMSWASVMAAAMLRRCVACFLTGQKKSRDKPEFIHWCCNSGTQYHGNAVLYTMLQHFAGNDAFSYLKSFNELSSDHPIFWFSLNRHHLTIAQPQLHRIGSSVGSCRRIVGSTNISIHKEHHQTKPTSLSQTPTSLSQTRTRRLE